MVKLRRVYEYNCFESQKDLNDLKDHLGDDLYNDYMKIRNKIPKDQNDYRDFQKLKNLPIEDIRDFVDNFQSEVDKRKEAKKGSKKLYEDSDWLVYKITTYPAAKYYGSGTKWCITGRYPGEEGRGEEFFNEYIEDNDLDDGYYFYINKKDPSEKYCVLQTKDKEIDSIWDAKDTNKGSTPVELGISLPKVKGVNLDTSDFYTIEGLYSLCRKTTDLEYLRNYIKELQKKGGDIINKTNKSGNSPLVAAFFNSFIADDLVKLLIKNGANVNNKNSLGETPLIICCRYENLTSFSIIKTLVENGADINAQDYSGKTALHYILDNPKIVGYLIEHGADTNIKDNYGKTPVDRASTKMKDYISSILNK